MTGWPPVLLEAGPVRCSTSRNPIQLHLNQSNQDLGRAIRFRATVMVVVVVVKQMRCCPRERELRNGQQYCLWKFWSSKKRHRHMSVLASYRDMADLLASTHIEFSTWQIPHRLPPSFWLAMIGVLHRKHLISMPTISHDARHSQSITTSWQDLLTMIACLD